MSSRTLKAETRILQRFSAARKEAISLLVIDAKKVLPAGVRQLIKCAATIYDLYGPENETITCEGLKL